MIENKNRNAAEAQSIQVAEDSREQAWKGRSFLAGLFMGEFDLSLAFPFPAQDAADRAAGDAICARVDAWAAENLDGDAIDANQEIPAHVWRGLKDLGLFGIKIPVKYGGLGMSQTNYMRILSVIARYCASTAATLSAHQSIGVPQPLKLFGTDEQKAKYLPRIAAGEVTAFGLTELSVGSDPANLTTHAEPDEHGDFILNGEKLWCTNGVVADLFVVMARTPSVTVNGKEKRQITAFIVEADWEGVSVVHRSRFMGLRAIENGVIRFQNVRVPKENVIGGVGNGLKLALTTLNDGRLGIPAMLATGAVEIAAFAARWAKSRVQWGKAVGAHEPGSEKLSFLASSAYAMSALADYCAALSDRGDMDIRMEAAAAKMYNTELYWQVCDVSLQLRGGRGFETGPSVEARGEASIPMERLMRDARIHRIVEGTTDVMHLFLAREALDRHLQMAGPLFRKGSLGSKLATVLKCGTFYAPWYAKLWLGGLFRSFGDFDPKLAGALGQVERRGRRLARTLFHQMLLKGPKLEMRQNILARLVDIGAELAVMSLVASRAQSELRAGNRDNLDVALYWLNTRNRVVDALFDAVHDNADQQATALAGRLMAAAEALPALASHDHLDPIQRDRGRDLTGGQVIDRGGEATPSAAK